MSEGIDRQAALRGPAAFFGLLGLFYIFFADNAYRQYYVYTWLGGNGPSAARNTCALLGSMALSWGLFAGGIFAACWLFKLTAVELGWRKPAERLAAHVLPGAYLGLLAHVFNAWLVTGVLFLLQQGSLRAFYSFAWSSPGFSAVPTPFSAAALLNTAVIAPVMEELVFRGFIFRALSRRMDIRWSVLLTSVLFSLMHLSLNTIFLSGNAPWWVLNQFIYHFVSGLLFNVLLIRSRSLVAPISAHIAYNLSTSFLLRTIS
ncbi:MAG: lysostaphin resistance A-like protein [Elusimicrobiales bacterium]